MKGQYSAAYAILQQASKIIPGDRMIQRELTILKKKSEIDAQSEKNLYRKMLGNKKSKQNEVACNSKNGIIEGIKAKLALGIIGGTAVAVVGVFAYKFIA